MRVQPAGAAAIDLGVTEANPTVSLIDFSRRVTDDFGVTTVVERGFSRRMAVRLAVPFDQVDGVQRRLADLRATAATWTADPAYRALSFTGFYKEFALDLAVPPLSFCSLTVESTAETPFFVDPGGEVAPDGKASTLTLLAPINVVGGVLAASNVPENDAPAWAAGTSSVKAAKVVRQHRVYESLKDANTADPEGQAGDWLDLGPTNRWAMFDDALGTATRRDGSISVTLSVVAADAVALLDVIGSTVRVVAPGYDSTVLVERGAAIFLDLPLFGGDVSVTIAGAGQVSAGTLLVGRRAPLGIIEASPTAGITDFSRKEVDDFGGVEIVERAWAKRMAANALIRADALDLVFDRVAAVRARPALWIGDAGHDSLTIYGFFKDFSIEVGDSVSKLSLSIEGLSQAAPLAQPIAEQLAEIVEVIEATVERLDAIELGTASRVFFQNDEPPSPPAKLNDLWLEEDTGKAYVYLGEGTLEQLAIGADELEVIYVGGEPVYFGRSGGWVLTKLSGAVSAGGNVYYLQEDPPAEPKVGDSWFRPSTGVLSRWSGTDWVATADRTAQVVPTIAGIVTVQIAASSTGVTTTPLPKSLRLRAMEGATDRSTAAHFVLGTLPGGLVATINDVDGSADRGVLTITRADAGGPIPVTVTFPGGGVRTDVVTVQRTVAPQDATGNAGGTGGAGTGASEVSARNWYDPIEATHRIVTPILTVRTGSAGDLTFAAYGAYGSMTPASANVAIKAAYRAIGTSAWTDVAGEQIGAPAIGDYEPGFVAIPETVEDGLTAGTDYEVALFARLMTSARQTYWNDAVFSVRGS